MEQPKPLGSTYLGNGRAEFLVWAPRTRHLSVHVVGPPDRRHALEPLGDDGYFAGDVTGVGPGSLYAYILDDGRMRPDPASWSQPQGVHGPSAIVDPIFAWTDQAWKGLDPASSASVLYELHVGTFTESGTLEAMIPRLDHLVDLGVTAIELMPVSQFSGDRNWGYDGVYPFAVQHSYGGLRGLQRLVNACHTRGLGVLVDVVYNHLGPEGNYLADFGPYFTDAYRTPWGPALNFDGPGSDHVRRYFLEHAKRWRDTFHLDGYRFDAVHAVVDVSARPFWEELTTALKADAQKTHRGVWLIAESDLNAPRVVMSPEDGGWGFDAQWSDDFHHALHTILTSERVGYYQDFGPIHDLADAFSFGFVLRGQYSRYRQRRHGRPFAQVDGAKLVAYSQNHDQVGNRAQGQRLSTLVPSPALKPVAAAVLLSPFVPLLFMGEEFGETAPFLYFVNHSDPKLVDAVRQGRQAECHAFGWQESVPDPDALDTFCRSRIHPESMRQEDAQALYKFYQRLIQLRRECPALTVRHLHPNQIWTVGDKTLAMARQEGSQHLWMAWHFDSLPITPTLPMPPGHWTKILDTDDPAFGGPGPLTPTIAPSAGTVVLPLAPWSFVLFEKARISPDGRSASVRS